MERFFFHILLVLLAVALPARAVTWTHPKPLRPDSSNFVTASLLVASPGEAIYSRLGHCTLRMECPTQNLDYCFSFETDITGNDYFRFFAGQSLGHIVAVPTREYLAPFQQEGRSVTAYVLNLSHREKQELWRLLDNDVVDESQRKFNFLTNNCTSISFHMIEDCLIEEQIDYHWPDPMNQINGDGIRYLTRTSPWLQFISLLLVGSEADTYWDNRNRVAPELMIPIEQQSSIVRSDGTKRPVLTGERHELVPLTRPLPPASRATPTAVFGTLLLLVLLITLIEWKPGWRAPARVADIVLLTLQTTLGIALLYMSCVSGLFGTHWNWYLVVFNPLPLLLWLELRKRPWYHSVYWVYTLVLVLFIIATPLSAQLDLPHQLVTATLAVRTAAHALRPHRRRIEKSKISHA